MIQTYDNESEFVSLVSVIITTKNRKNLLRRAIDSVLNQSYKDFEIIIVDDGSTDNTHLIANEYVKNYQNITYIKNETSMGACFARNTGITAAKGKFITGLDDDDEFMPERLQKMIDLYDEKYSFICSEMLIIEKDRSRVSSGKRIITFEDNLWKNTVGTQVLVEKKRIQSIGGFDEELPNSQDHDMWLRLLKKYGPAYKYNKPLYIWHTEHDNPRIGTSKKRLTGFMKVYNKNKKYMTVKQRMYNMIRFRKESGKPVYLKYIFVLFGTKYFTIELIRYFYRPIKNLKLPKYN